MEVTARLNRFPATTVLQEDVVQGLVGQPVYDAPGSRNEVGRIVDAWVEPVPESAHYDLMARLSVEDGPYARVMGEEPPVSIAQSNGRWPIEQHP